MIHSRWGNVSDAKKLLRRRLTPFPQAADLSPTQNAIKGAENPPQADDAKHPEPSHSGILSFADFNVRKKSILFGFCKRFTAANAWVLIPRGIGPKVPASANGRAATGSCGRAGHLRVRDASHLNAFRYRIREMGISNIGSWLVTQIGCGSICSGV